MEFNVAFKYHKKINTNNNKYPWPVHVQLDKYAPDWKILNKDLLFGMIDCTQKIVDSNFFTDHLLGYCFKILNGKFKRRVNSVSLMQIF